MEGGEGGDGEMEDGGGKKKRCEDEGAGRRGARKSEVKAGSSSELAACLVDRRKRCRICAKLPDQYRVDTI